MPTLTTPRNRRTRDSRTTLDDLGRELIWHGGCLLTRREVYRLESWAERPALGIGSPGWWAFRREAADLTDVDVAGERLFSRQCFPELFVSMER